MSQEDLDPEDVELSPISVRGSPASAASFVRDLASPAQSTARHSFESAASASPAIQPDPVRSTLFSSPARTTSSLSPSSETRASIAASFPPCPGHLLDSLAPRLRGPTSGEYRIRRAWVLCAGLPEVLWPSYLRLVSSLLCCSWQDRGI